MLPDSILPTPEDDIARVLRNYEKRLSHLETLEGAAGGAWTLIEDILLAADAATVDFQNIPATHTQLIIMGYARSDLADVVDRAIIRFNNDAGNNYDFVAAQVRHPAALATDEGVAATSAEIGVIGAANGPVNTFESLWIEINNYANTSNNKSVLSRSTMKLGTTTGNFRTVMTSAWWRDNSAINRITLLPNLGANFVTGTRFSLYGVT